MLKIRLAMKMKRWKAENQPRKEDERFIKRKKNEKNTGRIEELFKKREEIWRKDEANEFLSFSFANGLFPTAFSTLIGWRIWVNLCQICDVKERKCGGNEREREGTNNINKSNKKERIRDRIRVGG